MAFIRIEGLLRRFFELYWDKLENSVTVLLNTKNDGPRARRILKSWFCRGRILIVFVKRTERTEGLVSHSSGRQLSPEHIYFGLCLCQCDFGGFLRIIVRSSIVFCLRLRQLQLRLQQSILQLLSLLLSCFCSSFLFFARHCGRCGFRLDL